MKKAIFSWVLLLFVFLISCKDKTNEEPTPTPDPCDNASNEDTGFAPFTVGQLLSFSDSAGVAHITLSVEKFSDQLFPYYNHGNFCTRKITWTISTPWLNAQGVPLEIKGQLVDYAVSPERIFTVEPEDFRGETFFYVPGFGSNNGRVFKLDTYTFAGKTFQDVLLARCGEPTDLGYSVDKCQCPFTQLLVFERNRGLVALENSEGKWLLD